MKKIKYAYLSKNSLKKNQISSKEKTSNSFIKITSNSKKYNINTSKISQRRVWSCENINFYCNSSKIYSAPGVKKDKKEIKNVLKMQKNQTKNNIYNLSKIKENKTYREELNLNGLNSRDNFKLCNLNNSIEINDKYERALLRYKFLKKNISENSSIIFKNFKKNKNKYSSKNDSFSSTNTNYNSKIMQVKSTNESYLTKTNSNSKISTIKSIKYFFNSKKKNNFFDIDYNKNSNNNTIINLEMSNMSLEINKICFQENMNIKNKLSQLGKIILKFNIFKQYQKERLKNILKNDAKFFDGKLTLLKINFKKYDLICINYFSQIKDYISFIKKKAILLNNALEQENRLIFNLYLELEKLVIDNIIKQNELEVLLSIKNFLIQVKNGLYILPIYYNVLLKKKTRKYELAKAIISLKIFSKNQYVIKFMQSIPEIKQGIINDLNNNEYLNKKEREYDNEKRIFNNPDEFIDFLGNLENNNINLIKRNIYIKDKINLLKNECKHLNEKNLRQQFTDDIKSKEDYLKAIKEENLSLTKICNCYLSQPEKSDKNSFKAIKKNYVFDLNFLKKSTYEKLIAKNKKKGIFLLEKLINMLQDFFNCNYCDYQLLEIPEFIEIKKLNSKKIKNLDNKLIDKYIISGLKLFENICDFVINKNKELNSKEENKELIYKKKEEIQIKRKIQNAKDVLLLAEERRINGIKMILKKNSGINSLIKIKMDVNIELKNKIQKRESLKENLKHKHNFREKEFNFYVNYY